MKSMTRRKTAKTDITNKPGRPGFFAWKPSVVFLPIVYAKIGLYTL